MADFVRYPQGQVLLRDLQWDYPIISHGQGVYLFDTNGKRYIDGCGGAFVSCLGHSNERVVNAIAKQSKKVAYINGKHFTSAVVEELAQKIVTLTPPGLNRVAMLNSGSDAVEAAVKFVLQWHTERGDERRKKIIARSPGYHGNTFMALAMSARPSYRKFFGSHLSQITFVSAPYEYRNSVSGDYFKNGAEFYLKELEETILRENPKEIAAFILEPAGASSTLASLPPDGYLKGVQELCKRYGILTIGDEIAVGSGRSGKFFASSHWDFEPDVFVLGKAINAGYVPLALMIVRDEHLKDIYKESGSYMHAQTYLQSPSVAAGGLAVLNEILERSLMKNCEIVGSYIQKELRAQLSKHSHVAHVTGKGMMIGIEFVQDKNSKKPFSRDKKIAENLAASAFHRGVVVWVSTGMAQNAQGDGWIIAPPFTMNLTEANELVNLLVQTIESDLV